MQRSSLVAIAMGIGLASSMEAVRAVETYRTSGAFGAGYKSPTKENMMAKNQAKAARRKMAKASKRKNRK